MGNVATKTEIGGMTLVVSNTGPILHLHEADLLELLELCGEIHIPSAVQDELSTMLPRWGRHFPEWIIVHSLTDEQEKEAESLFRSGLVDPGEAEAIALSKQLKPKWFLTDDTRARVLAGTFGLEVHGTLGVVIWSAAVGHRHPTDAQKAISRLTTTSLWISNRVVQEARKALEALLLGEDNE